MDKIIKISAREIIDSRANPTLEAEVTLSSGKIATAQVPSGASKGENEAFELRDTANKRFLKRGVLEAVKNVNEIINPALVGMDVLDIDEADSVMIALDGMYNKSNLGANAILAVSIAVLKAGALSLDIPLYRYIGGALAKRIPLPMMNILNGGAHADNNIDIQEFMIVPVGAPSFADGVRMCSEVYGNLKNILRSDGYATTVGDEGGFAPMLESDEEAIKLILKAVELAGYEADSDFKIALDVAASQWKSRDGYVMTKRKKSYTSSELIDYYCSLSSKYPIMSIEDALDENDIEGWKRLTEKMKPYKTLLVGDDLFVTDSERIKNGVNEGIANSVLIKPNQVGTVTETANAVFSAKKSGYKTIMSHRSGDTEDTFIADLAVGLSCDFIKSGAPARAERTAKYNRLMKIESELFFPICEF